MLSLRLEDARLCPMAEGPGPGSIVARSTWSVRSRPRALTWCSSRAASHQGVNVIDSPFDRLKPAMFAAGSRNHDWKFSVAPAVI